MNKQERDTISAIHDLMPALNELFGKIAADSRDGEGVTRDAFGARETEAAETLAAFAQQHGLEPGYDSAGNLHVTAPGQSSEPAEIIIASHVDSVPVGGNYDGLAGVIAGLAALIALVQHDSGHAQGLRVIGFRGEESPWFGTAYLGSKLLLGLMSQTELHALRRYDTGKTLAEHIAALGLDPTRPPKPIVSTERLKAYFEVHIEQAPLLERLGQPLGVATAIRGNIRHPAAKCFGEYAHSGAVPRAYRRDALIAAAKLIAFADRRWEKLIGAGNDDLVFTCGIFHTDTAEHTMTKVPGEVTFSLNIGGTKNEIMEELQNSIEAEARELANHHGVKFDFGNRRGTPAVGLDKRLISAVTSAAEAIGISPVRMPTVGHDAAMFQHRGVPSAVLLLRNTHGSHNPKEHMEMVDFEAGVKALTATLLRGSF